MFMYSKMLVLRFSKSAVEKPIVCSLAREFDLTFNILNATILPRNEGVMVMQLSGTPQNFERGVRYPKNEGILIQNAEEEISRDEIKCTHCGACTAVCPTGALSIERPGMQVVFDREKCSICKLCVSACPPHAMELRPADDNIVLE
jgi:ferredoxin